MALFGENRDILLINSLNRELLSNIISQQVAVYKYDLRRTKPNLYGETNDARFYNGPYLFNCLIDRQDQVYSYGEEGVNFNQIVKVAFFKKDLEEAEVLVEVGDIFLYQEAYYAISGIVENQYFIGKNPDYPNNPNPLNPGLENYGESISLVCVAYFIPADKINISPIKERF